MSREYLNVKNPFDTNHKFYLLIEVGGDKDGEMLSNSLLSLLEHLEEEYQDGIVSESETQLESIWKLRESISLGTASYGLVINQFNIKYRLLNLT